MSLLLIVLGIVLRADDSAAGLCKKWGEPRQLGTLEKKDVGEASGMGFSRKYPGRLYWINDSGNKEFLYHSQRDGKDMKKIRLLETKFLDTEAMAVTDCGEEPCVIIADVGNLGHKKRDPVLHVFLEKDLNGESAKPFRKVKFTWPDGPHDVEAMAALPNGDILFITKELSLGTLVEPTLFTLTKGDWLTSVESQPPVAKDLGKLPVPKWLPDKGFLGTAVTDAAVNYEREVLGVLTYGALVEMPLEFVTKLRITHAWEAERDFATVPVKALTQQESMAYVPKGDEVMWASEFLPPKAPIYSISCERTGY